MADDWPSLGPRPRSRRGLRPEVQDLEPRDLTVITGVSGEAVPRFLQPPNGRTVQVRVSGLVSNNIPERPSADFRVVDEYRLVQPTGSVTLKPEIIDPKAKRFVYSYSFTIKLPAQVAAHDISGRSYYILISAGDRENGSGKYIPALVPNGRAPRRPRG